MRYINSRFTDTYLVTCQLAYMTVSYYSIAPDLHRHCY